MQHGLHRLQTPALPDPMRHALVAPARVIDAGQGQGCSAQPAPIPLAPPGERHPGRSAVGGVGRPGMQAPITLPAPSVPQPASAAQLVSAQQPPAPITLPRPPAPQMTGFKAHSHQYKR